MNDGMDPLRKRVSLGENDPPSGILSITSPPLGCHTCILLVFFSIDMDMTGHVANVNSYLPVSI